MTLNKLADIFIGISGNLNTVGIYLYGTLENIVSILL